MSNLLYIIAPLFAILTSCSTGNFISPRGTIINEREKTLISQGYVSFPLNSNPGDTRYWNIAKLANQEMPLLLDTGANGTTVFKNSADSIGLKDNTNIEVISKGALGEMRSRLSITNLEYGTQLVSPFLVSITTRKTNSSFGQYNGIMGLDALVESATLIDIASKKVWMPKADIDSKTFPYLSKNLNLGSDSVSIFPHDKYNHLILFGFTQGQKSNWIIDTGAEGSIIDSHAANRLGLKVKETEMEMVDSTGETSKLGLSVVPNLRLGRTTIFSLPVAVADLKNVRNYLKLPDGSTIDGILGVDFLINSRALIDPRSKVIHLGLRGRDLGNGYLSQSRNKKPTL